MRSGKSKFYIFKGIAGSKTVFKTKKYNFKWICFAADFVIWIILTFMVYFSFSLAISRSIIGIPSILGNMIVQIQSGSMEESGFEIGSRVLVREAEPSSLKNGDIIAFWYYCDLQPGYITPNGRTPKPAPKTSKIVFHEIVEINTDLQNRLWFRTKGSNNHDPDPFWIYEEYVIGKNVAMPDGLSGFVNFLFGPLGMLTLVTTPAVIIMAFNILNLVFVIIEIQRENTLKIKDTLK